jgi:hypothetical protein
MCMIYGTCIAFVFVFAQLLKPKPKHGSFAISPPFSLPPTTETTHRTAPQPQNQNIL